MNTNNVPLVVAFIIIIIALQMLFAIPVVRRYWLEIDLIALILFGLAIFYASPFTPPQYLSTNTSDTSPTPSPPYNSFLLPADKIQTDLKGFQIGESVTIDLIVDDKAQSYQAQITAMSGIGNETPNPPYSVDLVKIAVKLQNESGDTTNFVQYLVKAKEIFILHGTSNSTSFKSPATTFLLPLVR